MLQCESEAAGTRATIDAAENTLICPFERANYTSIEGCDERQTYARIVIVKRRRIHIDRGVWWKPVS